MNKLARISYLFIFGTLLVVGLLKLGPPFLAVLFSYLLLNFLNFKKRKAVAVSLFLVVVALISFGFVHFIREATHVLPEVLEASIPKLKDYSAEYSINLPFDDLASLKELLKKGAHDQFGDLAKLGDMGDQINDVAMVALRFAGTATKEFVYIIISLVVAVAIFLNSAIDLDRAKHPIRNNVYSLLCIEISQRFSAFYKSFETVMGAQLLISLINTSFTGLFVLFVHLPHPAVIIGITFLCGLLPIVGNLISNTIICAIALTMSLNATLEALGFLIVLHKFEYFLNSKIIGGRIRNPMWLTLLGLLIGEKTMGIPGMILAPVILNYLKIEGSQIEVTAADRPELV